MSDRKGPMPRDEDGEPLVDAGVLLLMVRTETDKATMTARDLRRWVLRHGLPRVRRGAHGAWLYRRSDVAAVLDRQADPG